MSDVDTAVEYWKSQYKDLPEAELEMKVDRILGHLPEHKAARHVLADLRNARNQSRHQESLDRADIAIRYAKWALIAAVVGVAVGIVGMWLPFAARTPARTDVPSPSISLGATTDPVPSTPSVPAIPAAPTPPIHKPDKKPATSPTLPKE